MPPVRPSVFATNLKALLSRSRYAGSSSRQLSEQMCNRLGRTLGHSAIANHMNGKVVPTKRNVKMWAELLNVTEHDLLEPLSLNVAEDAWRNVLRAICASTNATQFLDKVHLLSPDASEDSLYTAIRGAMHEAVAAGKLDLGWMNDPAKESALREAFQQHDLDVTVVKCARDCANRLYEAAADSIWQHVMKVFHHSRVKNASGSPVVVKAAIGSGASVAAVVDLWMQRIALERQSDSHSSGLPLSFEFHPMAASINTRRPADNIPSVFLHNAIERQGLSTLHERVFPTPDNAYAPSGNVRWFYDNVDIFITSVASMTHEHSMLAQHLGVLGFPISDAVGEVQFRPYSKSEFIKPHDRRLPKTLLPIEELPKFCKKIPRQRERPLAILVAGPCPICNELKDEAILPLIVTPRLRVFNRVFMDNLTAEALLARSGDRKRRRARPK